MTHTLIVKLNATGDVVRTTTLLRRLPGPVTWITASGNLPLLEACVTTCGACLGTIATAPPATVRPGDQPRGRGGQRRVRRAMPPARVFGARLDADGTVGYSEDARDGST